MQANTDNTKRNALIAQLQKLRAMTTANGCTEAEANNAAAMAQKLMDQYGVTMSDIKAADVPDNLCEQGEFTGGRKKMHEVRFCAGLIGEFTHCQIWHDQDYKTRQQKIVFFGLVADVQVAQYLMGVFQVAMDTEFAKHWKVERYLTELKAPAVRRAFMLGMASRLRERLKELIAAREQEQAQPNSESRALVVVKDQIVAAAMAHAGIRLSTRMMRSSIRDRGSYQAGKAAGDGVTIASGALGHKSSPRLN